MSASGRCSGILHLNLKGEYFDQIADGVKQYEYRLCNNYWKKRLVGRHYDGIVIKRGYPKRGDANKAIRRPWCGYELQTVIHPYFGPNRVWVFAIRVNSAATQCMEGDGYVSHDFTPTRRTSPSPNGLVRMWKCCRSRCGKEAWWLDEQLY